MLVTQLAELKTGLPENQKISPVVTGCSQPTLVLVCKLLSVILFLGFRE